MARRKTARQNSSKAAQKRKMAGRPFARMSPVELHERRYGAELHAEGAQWDPLLRAMLAEESKRKLLTSSRSVKRAADGEFDGTYRIELDDGALEERDGQLHHHYGVIEVTVERRPFYTVYYFWFTSADRSSSFAGTALVAANTRLAEHLRHAKWAFEVRFKEGVPSIPRNYDSGFVFPNEAAAAARLEAYLVRLSGRKRVLRDVALPGHKWATQARRNPSGAVKAWRAEMRAKYGPKWFEVEGVKETRPGGRVREKMKAGKGPKTAADAGGRKPKPKPKPKAKPKPTTALSAMRAIEAQIPSTGPVSVLVADRLLRVWKNGDGEWVWEVLVVDEDGNFDEEESSDAFESREDAIDYLIEDVGYVLQRLPRAPWRIVTREAWARPNP